MPAVLLPLLGVLLAAGPTPPSDEADFLPPQPAPSVALGPAGAKHFVFSADVGWLRSGVGAAIGVADTVDLTLRADAFFLKALLNEQHEIMAGVRWAVLSDGLVRLSLGAEAGSVGFGGDVAPTSALALRGQAVLGVALEGIATPYVRGALRLVSYRSTASDGLMPDGEIGGGVERAFGPWVAGAEAFAWVRSGGLAPLAQWRLRAGRRF